MFQHRRKGHSDEAIAGSPEVARWGLLAVLSLAQLMVILDISAVNVALPDLASDLDRPRRN